MIKCDKGSTKLEGKTLDLIAELACIVHSLRSAFTEKGMKDGEAVSLIKGGVEDGLLTEEEIEEKKKDVIDWLQDLINEVFNKNEKEDDDNG